MNSEKKIILRWYGAAHYHLHYKGLKIIIDPLFQRAARAKPHLVAKKEDVEQLDFLLLTHAHLDHSWDLPYLASKHHPELYAPRNYLSFIKKKEKKWNLNFDHSKCHNLEQQKGSSFNIADILVTPFQVGTEKVDSSVIINSLVRGIRHWSFDITPTGVKFLLYHLKGNCFAFHFDFKSINKTMLYFGNVTDKVYDMDEIDDINLLVLPYCPASNDWLNHTLYLIGRFKSDTILIHHYDNFWHPITHPMYRNLNDYRHSIQAMYPDVKLIFSKFYQDVEFSELLGRS